MIRSYSSRVRPRVGFFLSALLLLIVALHSCQCVPKPEVTSFEELFSTPVQNASYAHVTCDEEQLRSLSQQVETLQSSNENLHVKLDTYNLRLSHIKELLDQRLPSGGVNEQPAQWIEVRAGAEASQQKLNTSCTPYTSDSLPTTCAEAVERAGPDAKSGVYQLYLPASGLKPFYAYCLCDPLGGAAWTVIQRRQDGSTPFHRNWREYEHGFGNLYNEFFIGLQRLHAITHAHLNELWIELSDFDNATRYARYEEFAIGDANELYAMQVLGAYSGNAGDSLTKHQGQKFSTLDKDNDSWERNCAAEYTGAWWYKACHDSNLNGQYLSGTYDKKKYGKGIDWLSWRGHLYSMKYVHMAIRPKAGTA